MYGKRHTWPSPTDTPTMVSNPPRREANVSRLVAAGRSAGADDVGEGVERAVDVIEGVVEVGREANHLAARGWQHATRAHRGLDGVRVAHDERRRRRLVTDVVGAMQLEPARATAVDQATREHLVPCADARGVHLVN